LKNIRYAFASVSYHKKISFSLGIFSILFLTLSTSLLNLIDIENIFYTEVKELANISIYVKNYQKLIHLYSVMYIVLLVVALIFICGLIFSAIQIKKQDMLKWRIMGFKNHFIIKQAVLETLIPLLTGVLFTAVALLVCQHTYEFLLTSIKPWLSQLLGLERVAFFSSNAIIESTPNQIMHTNSNTNFISLGITNLDTHNISTAFIKNSLLLIVAATISTIASSYTFLKKRPQY
jgi:uncharacterized membrane protein